MRTGRNALSKNTHSKNEHTHAVTQESGDGQLSSGPNFSSHFAPSALQIPSTFQLLRPRSCGFRKQANLENSTRCRDFQRKRCCLEDGAKFIAVVVVLIDGALQIEFSAEGCSWHGLTDWSTACSFRFWAVLQLRLHCLTSLNHLQPIDHHALGGSSLSHWKINRRKPICAKLCVTNICYHSTYRLIQSIL